MTDIREAAYDAAVAKLNSIYSGQIPERVAREIADAVLDTAPQSDPWTPIYRLVGWLDRQNGRTDHEISMRLLKLVEEAGEVAQAYIGSTGQNPRKGVTHTRQDVADELCDVIITAMVALVSVADRAPDDILAEKLAKVTRRATTEGGAR